jgi:hypothetical protein
VYSTGASHEANGSASSEHSNVAPPSSAEKLKTASTLEVVCAGFEWIVVSGGVRSALTAQV